MFGNTIRPANVDHGPIISEETALAPRHNDPQGGCGPTDGGVDTSAGGGSFIDRGGWISRPANIDTGGPGPGDIDAELLGNPNRDIMLTTGEDAPVHPLLNWLDAQGGGSDAFVDKSGWIADGKPKPEPKPDGGTKGPECTTQAGKDVPCDPATLAREGYGPHGHSGTMADDKVPKTGTKMTADGASIDMSNVPDLLDIGGLLGGKEGGFGDSFSFDFSKALPDLSGKGGGLSGLETGLDRLDGFGKDGPLNVTDMMSMMEAFDIPLDHREAFVNALDAFGGTDDDSLFKALSASESTHVQDMIAKFANAQVSDWFVAA